MLCHLNITQCSGMLAHLHLALLCSFCFAGIDRTASLKVLRSFCSNLIAMLKSVAPCCHVEGYRFSLCTSVDNSQFFYHLKDIDKE